jgi:AcrR family transcriptional regulator
MVVEFPPMPRTGRRPGPSTTRAASLEAARRRFAAAGYDATSLRAIADDAGVDPSVLSHFFGSKAGLFRAVVGWPFDPARLEPELAGPGQTGIGARLARNFFGYWEDPTTGAALAALLRSAMTHAESAALLREFVVHDLFARLAGLVGGRDADLRVELAAAQLVGVALLRYILRVEPIASAGTTELVAWLEPALDRYLQAGGLPGQPARG